MLFEEKDTGCKLCRTQGSKIYHELNNNSDILCIYERENQTVPRWINDIFAFNGVKNYNVICAIGCQMPKNKKVQMSKYCMLNIKKIIADNNIKKVLIIGDFAFEVIIKNRLSGRISFSGSKEKFTGWVIPDQDLRCNIMYISNFYEEQQENMKAAQYIKQFLNSKDFIEYDYEKTIKTTKDINTAIEYLDYYLENSKYIVFDYETTGIKPHSDNHKIVCVSICDDTGFISAFPIFYDNITFMKKLKSILTGSIEKIAHNGKYELNWTDIILGYDVNNFVHDTMISSHIIDNRRGICGLKFQSYFNFGILPYDNKIDKYLKSSTSNSINKVKDAPLDDLLYYCAIDSYVTDLLYQKNIGIINNDKHLQSGYELFHNAILTLQNVEKSGFMIDTELVVKNDKELEVMLYELDDKIKNSEYVKMHWDKEKTFNHNSNEHLQYLLYEKMGYSAISKTKGGSGSTDQDNLKAINIKLTNDILEYKSLDKIRNTYFDGFKREICNGIIHPSFNLHTVMSYRSSSSNPNFQNIPKRSEIAKKYIRSLIVCVEGEMIVEIDYSGIEVSVGCCYHKDQNMINYVINPENDMHRDTGAQLIIKDAMDITGTERQAAKNGFVFPQFYGDWYKACAENIWDQIDNETKRHLKSKGIGSLNKFISHVQEVEHDFWYNRFGDYQKWKDANWKRYLRRGYVELKTGFYLSNVLNYKQVNNAAIQGTAFHCLLWSLINVNKYIMNNNFQSRIIGQIHDSMILRVKLDEWERLKPAIKQIMLYDIRDYWKWIIVPLRAEIDYYPRNWYEKKKSEKL